MELAVNQFNKGLQTDTHPMSQGNESLSDCLNGTLITMNGNEMILQNDMGNRRVNRAYLPSGYLPVGMKEYGGIIYVAAYNPITGKSQIGSFPSPLRKIDLNYQNDLGGTFNFDSFFENDNQTKKYIESLKGEVKFLDSDSFLIPLTQDISIHAGDKFSIYCNKGQIKSLGVDYLTNYYNVRPEESTVKAYSPKNKLFTILVGILNSLNEFVDITKTLCRWKNATAPEKYDSSYSEIYKFNDGYFIAPGFNNENLLYAINDANLIKLRQLMAVNTYAYKLIGPMYLKINLNHITGFNYDIYGLYDDGVALLQIDGYITYNCPDGGMRGNEIPGSNENYITFEDFTPSRLRGFDLIDSDSGSLLKRSLDVMRPSSITRSVYDPSTNTYSVKITKNYKNIIGNENKIYNFFLGVQACTLNEEEFPNTLYLKGLSVEGSIDLSLLNSGKVLFKEWRFHNNMTTNETILTFSINAYPKLGLKFSNLRFKFEDITNNENVFYYPTPPEDLLFDDRGIPQYDGKLPVYNGRQTLTINWNIQPRKVYKVTTYYHDSLSNKDILLEGEYTDRWFLSTELFNEFYHTIDDFCHTDDQEFLDKMKIKLHVNSSSTNNSENLGITEVIGSLFIIKNLLDNSIHNYGHKYSIDLDISVNPTIEILDEELYPDFIQITNTLNIEIESFDVCELDGNKIANITQLNNKLLEDYVSYSENETSSLKRTYNLTLLIKENKKITNHRITGLIDYYDYFYSYFANHIENIENSFKDILYFVEQQISRIKINNNEFLFAGVSLDGVSPDENYVDVIYSEVRDNQHTFTRDGNGDIVLNSDNTHTYKIEGIVNENTHAGIFYNAEYKIYEFRELANWGEVDTRMRNNKQAFTYFFPFYNHDENSTNYDSCEIAHGLSYSPEQMDCKKSYNNAEGFARIWWLTNTEGLIMLDDFIWTGCSANDRNIENNEIIGDKDDLKSTILRIFNNRTYIFCMYNSENISDKNIYSPGLNQDYVFKNVYNNTLKYDIKYKPININNINFNSKLYGNLKFELDNIDYSSQNVEFKLKSDYNFLDFITDDNTAKNLYIKLNDNGEITSFYVCDNKNKYLNPGIVYYELDNSLILSKNDSMCVIRNEGYREENLLVFKLNNNTPTYRYDHYMFNNRFSLDYEGAGVIKPLEE